MNRTIIDILWSDTFFGISSIVIGVLPIVYRKQFARKAVRRQNAFRGLRMGQRDVRISELVAVPRGIAWIVMGIWMLLDTFG